MKNRFMAAIALVLASGVSLAAQDAHLGLSVNLNVPTGAFSSTTYAGPITEAYDPALGVAFTASFPVDRSMAFRLNLSGTTFSGHADEPGYDRYNLQDAMFSLGGEVQLFMAGGDAQRHLGSYLIGGLSVDLERFSASYGDPSFYADNAVSKTRLGATVGFGHSFRYVGRWRWNMEVTFHKTLTAYDTNAGDPPPADFVRVGAGIVF